MYIYNLGCKYTITKLILTPKWENLAEIMFHWLALPKDLFSKSFRYAVYIFDHTVVNITATAMCDTKMFLHGISRSWIKIIIFPVFPVAVGTMYIDNMAICTQIRWDCVSTCSWALAYPFCLKPQNYFETMCTCLQSGIKDVCSWWLASQENRSDHCSWIALNPQ